MSFRWRWCGCLLACCGGMLLMARQAAALQPDEIALVINKNVPESRKLAEEYAKLRHIPDGRIIETTSNPIAVAAPAEEISYEDFEPQIARPIRDFLTRSNLRDQVKCLVTFWGVPLRVGPRTLGPLEVGELKQLQGDLAKTKGNIIQELLAIEIAAHQVDRTFLPEKGEQIGEIERRLNSALTHLVQGLQHLPDPQERRRRFGQVLGNVETLVGTLRTRQLIAEPAVADLLTHRQTPQDLERAREDFAKGQNEISQAEGQMNTPEGRAKVRDLARKYLGLLGSGMALAAQVDLFDTTETQAAVDSELSLLWWKSYPRRRWMENPLSFRYQALVRQRQRLPLTALMVSRLDGPGVNVVERLMQTSVRVEQQGLAGQVVLDARGLPPTDGLGQYDQTLRNLAQLLQQKTKLKVTLDDKPALLPAHQLNDPPIALYCGWYSLRNYSPPGRFAEGAVGYHVASFELISLRLPNERGWVRGLLSDGVVGTLGPVAEPYVQSFPTADEFFPLLLTGKLTLAEVYWRTTPMASWMQTLIGDPLYTPYQKDPPLSVSDLPAGLAAALQPPATTEPAPATQPAAAGR